MYLFSDSINHLNEIKKALSNGVRYDTTFFELGASLLSLEPASPRRLSVHSIHDMVRLNHISASTVLYFHKQHAYFAYNFSHFISHTLFRISQRQWSHFSLLNLTNTMATPCSRHST